MKSISVLAGLIVVFAGRAWADCGLQDDIDVPRLPGRPPAYAADVLKSSREHLPAPVRPTEIRAGVTVAMIGGQQFLTAFRDARGWRVDRWAQRSARLSPGGGEPAAKLTHGRLSRQQGAKLDSLLASACLWRFPAYLPNTLPLKGGQDVTCMDGANLVLEVRAGRRRWTGAQECQIQGAPGEIYNLLSAAPGL